jgi:ketosteroid isomerase-like protein
MSTTPEPADVVRRYYQAVSDLHGPEEEVMNLLADDVRIVEHPNAITPNGAVRDRAEALAGLQRGRALLSQQRFALHEVLVQGDRVAVRATWTGVVGIDAGPLSRGDALTAQVAALLTVRDGRIVEHETFDCYAPLPLTEARG